MPKNEEKAYSPSYQSRVKGVLKTFEEVADAKGRQSGRMTITVEKPDGSMGGEIKVRVQHGKDFEHFKGQEIGKPISVVMVGHVGFNEKRESVLYTRASQMKAGYLDKGTEVKVSVGKPEKFISPFTDKKSGAPMLAIRGQIVGDPVKNDDETLSYPQLPISVFIAEDKVPAEVLNSERGCLIAVEASVLDLKGLREKGLKCNANEVKFLGAKPAPAQAAEAEAEEDSGPAPA